MALPRLPEIARIHTGTASLLAAFTLIEMLLVFVFIGILSSAVVVSFADRQDREALHAAVDDLAAALRYAASQAHLEERSYRVVFNGPRREYHLEAAQRGTLGFVRATGQAGRTRRIVSGVRLHRVSERGRVLAEIPHALLFDPSGFGFSGQVELVSRGDKKRYIKVYARTGIVDVLETRTKG